MKKFWIVLSICWLWTCSGGGESKSPTEPDGPTYIVDLATLQGQAQKGPFNNGTAINIAELTNNLSPTGRNFSSAITDNTGRFSVANVQLESPYVELRANGFYYNEVTGNASDAQLSLFALSDLTNKSSVNVNIISHLEKNRIINLMSGDNPKSFAEAKLQALTEVLTIFDFDATGVSFSESLDITQNGDGNAKLLAISAILQGNQSVAQMSELLANISTDISSDGILDNEDLKQKLKNNTSSLNVGDIRTNLEARLSQLGINGTIPDFESQVEHFLKRPTADDISTTTDQNQAIDIALTGTDPENDTLTFEIIQNPSGGSVSINESTATYIPAPTYTGTDYFFYVANDGNSNSDQARVEIMVNDINLAPTASDSSYVMYSDTELDIQLIANDFDGDNLSFNIISSPSNGSYNLYNLNRVIYTPSTGYSGTDSFTFTASDGEYESEVATVDFTIKPSPTWGTPDTVEGFHTIAETSDGNLIVGGFKHDSQYNNNSSVLVKFSQTGEIIWEELNSHAYGSIQMIKETADEGYLYILSHGAGSGDARSGGTKIIKTDNNGIEIWEYSIDIDSSERIYDVIESSDGHIVFVMSGVGGNGDNSDISITKMDSDYSIVWSNTFGSNLSETAYTVIESNDGNFFIGASTRGFGASDDDFYLVKVDSNGQKIFERIWGVGGSCKIQVIHEGSDSNLYITGEYDNGFYQYIGILEPINGNIVSEHVPFQEMSYGVYSMEPTPDGGFIMVTNHDMGYIEGSFWAYNVSILKVDSGMNLEWQRFFGSNSYNGQNDFGYGVVNLDNGGYAIVGSTLSFGETLSTDGSRYPNAFLLILDDQGNDRQSWE